MLVYGTAVNYLATNRMRTEEHRCNLILHGTLKTDIAKPLNNAEMGNAGEVLH